MALANLRSVLSGRDFRRLWGVRLVAQYADGTVQASLATYELFSPERQPTAAKVAAAFAILLLPYSLIGPFAGVFLDRWRRRQVLVWADVLRTGTTLVLALLVARSADDWRLALAVLVTLGIGRFVLTALSASLPHVVTGPDLVTANALTPTSGTIASAVGALVGVGIRAATGGGDHGALVVLGCAALLYLVAAAWATRIAKDRLGPFGDRPGESVGDVARGLVDGVRHLVHRPAAARAITLVVLHRVGFGALTVAALLLVRTTFNPPDQPDRALAQFALVTGSAALGAFLGAVATPWASRHWGERRWSAAALAQAGVVAAPLLCLVAFPALLLAALSVGFAGQAVKVCSDTIVQRAVSDDHLGRVFAIYDMVLNVGLVAGIVAVAFTAPATGITYAGYIAVGVLYVGAAAWYLRAGGTGRRRIVPTSV